MKSATDLKPIQNLLSEAGAEVVIEEQDIDDTDVKVGKLPYHSQYKDPVLWKYIHLSQ